VTAVLVTGGGTGIGAAVTRQLRAAAAVDVGTLPFDPRVDMRRDSQEGP
jgi:NAD(P)-dependent dehydrogenase (short-subunit alcohol dehydrogenase family)